MLGKGAGGVIVRICKNFDESHIKWPLDFEGRLLQLGFLEGRSIEVVHESPFGNNAIVVKVGQTLVAMRRSEANAVEVINSFKK
ncbi:MAG: ferrous iron transport protein A, partial [Silvanigrellaceae bacterium]|nr:ferrous iron transport protein A [Silvanigrellaceae bacterium]